MSRLKIAYFTNIAPHYRAYLWATLALEKKWEFHFFFGSSASIKAIDFSGRWAPLLGNIHHLRNIRFRGLLFFQAGFWRPLWRHRWHAVIVLGDMTIISNWIIALICRWRGIPVYFWGHGLYGNEGILKLLVRKRFLSLATGHFLYGEYARQLMGEQGFPPGRLHVVHNSLDYELHKSIRDVVIIPDFYKSRNYFTNNELPVLIFIGRLTPEKMLDRLFVAMDKLAFRQFAVNLIIVGDGPEKQRLQDAVPVVLRGNVCFYGACYDEMENGRLLANADLCVSPGNVGLTAIHSLSFGTPVCTHSDMRRQMPEAEAIVEGITGTFYDFVADDLSRVVENWFVYAHDRAAIRNNCYHVVDTRYNPDVQKEVFKSVLLSV